MTGPPSVSIVIAVYNEAENLPELLDRTLAVLDGLPGGSHQLWFVDDGSRDRTLELLEERAARDARIVVLSLSRNFGHQAALTAALDHVPGDAVVVMDGDLQDPPEAIPSMLERYRQGHDVVYAVRTGRKEGWLLRTCYAVFYRLAAGLSDLPLPIGSGDFGLMSRQVVDELRTTRERHRYLRGLRTWVGFRQASIPVERGVRRRGLSKYGVRGLFKLAFDGIFAFSVVPIRAATVLGALAMFAAVAFTLYALYAKLVRDQSPQGFTALIVAIVGTAGVLLLFLGVIGEYVGRIYEEVKRRPIYVIRRTVGVDLSGRPATR